METSDITVEILRSIRDEIRGTREDLRGEMRAMREDLSSRIDATNTRLDVTNERLDTLERRLTETDIRIATEMTAWHRDFRDTYRLLKRALELRPRVEPCEREIEGLKARLPES